MLFLNSSVSHKALIRFKIAIINWYKVYQLTLQMSAFVVISLHKHPKEENVEFLILKYSDYNKRQLFVFRIP